MRRRPSPRKLLVASVGVATLNYLPTACSSMGSSVANLMAPPVNGTGGRSQDASADAADAHAEASVPPSPTVANLVAPAPVPPSAKAPAKKGP